MTDWDVDKLKSVAAKRLEGRSKLQLAERALLAYARWQGLTHEDGIDRAAQKKTLDRLLDELEKNPTKWLGIQDAAATTEDPVIVGFLRHSLTRAADKHREDAKQTLESLPKAPQRKRDR